MGKLSNQKTNVTQLRETKYVFFLHVEPFWPKNSNPQASEARIVASDCQDSGESGEASPTEEAIDEHQLAMSFAAE